MQTKCEYLSNFYLISIPFQQYIAIHNKFTSVPLTDAHLQDNVQKFRTSNLNLVTTL